MAVIAPPNSTSKNSNPKPSKSFLGDALSAATNKLISTGEGRQVTVAQAMADRLINIAIFAEANTDAIAAQKLIYERVLGKAAVQKTEDVKQMPKVIFSLTEDGLDRVNESATKIIEQSDVEDDGTGLVVAQIDGKTYVG